MIYNLCVSNYRSFIAPVNIPLRPINIFVGPNSSGKSSLIKLFKMMQQSCSARKEWMEFVSFGREGDVFENIASLQGDNRKMTEIRFDIKLFESNHRAFLEETHFDTRGELFGIELHLGEGSQHLFFSGLSRSYDDVKKKRSLKIDANEILDENDGKIIAQYVKRLKNYFLKWIDAYPQIFEFGREEIIEHTQSFDPQQAYSELRYSGLIFQRDSMNTLNKSEDVGHAIGEFIDSHTPFGKEMFKLDRKYAEIIYDRKTWYDQFLSFLSEMGQVLYTHRNDPLSKIKSSELFLWWIEFIQMAYAVNKIDQWEPFLRTVYNPAMEDQFGSIVAISPLRARPQSVYSVDDLQRFVFYGLHKNQLPEEEKLKTLIAQIDDDLRYLGSPYKFQLRRIKDFGAKEIYAIEFIDKKMKKAFTLDDVGFGYSQILPIIAAIEGNRDYGDRTILIEQPELHLHPQFQSRLARVMANAITGVNRVWGSPNQLIIETHSEHVIRGFQVLVAKGLLTPDDIGIHYVSKDGRGQSHVKLFEMDEQGFFTETWPQGFFDQAFLQSLEMVAGKN